MALVKIRDNWAYGFDVISSKKKKIQLPSSRFKAFGMCSLGLNGEKRYIGKLKF